VSTCQPEIEQLNALPGHKDIRRLPVRDLLAVRGVKSSQICAAYASAFSGGSGPFHGSRSTYSKIS
jgi:hypothetical protein